MRIEEARERVEEIRREAARDDERAHGLEDALHKDVLKAIAEGARNGRQLAAEALTTSEIKFGRWCG
jgi:hypothetical protein